jgi:hypothetical protein
MRNRAADQDPQFRRSAHTEHGEIEFHRNSPAEAVLAIGYEVPILHADLQQAPLGTAVEALCEAEIANMRQSLCDLGEALAVQLSDEGKIPVIQQTHRNRDSRDWVDGGNLFSILPSSFRNETTLRGYEGVADARLVRESVDFIITQREQDIRRLYGQILADARNKRERRTSH